MKLSVLSSPAEIAEARPAWEGLAAQHEPGSMFATPRWHECWLRHVAPEATPAFVSMRGANGDLVALAPLCEWPYRDLGMSVPALRFSGREVVSGDYLDLVATPEAREEAMRLLLDHLAAAVRGGKLLLLGEIVRGSATEAAVRAWVAREEFSAHEQESRRCPCMDLPGSYEEYLASLSSKTRAHLRRKARRLGEEPGLKLRRITEPVEAVAALPELFRLHALRWESLGESGTFVRPGFREFLEDFIRTPPPSIRPQIYLFEEDGRAIASLLLFHGPRAALHYQGGWDPDTPHGKHSPLLVLTARSIEDAIAEGLSHFDFLRGDEAYKLDFTSTLRHTFTLVVAGGGLRARAYFTALQWKEKAKSVLRKDHPGTETVS